MMMALFDDMFDEFSVHHSLRIPPLIDPLPFLTATSDRPSPLEPNAGVNANIDNETAKLTGRRKALAEAKPLGDGEQSDLQPLQKNTQTDLRPIQKSPRKRQKLYDHEHIADFVQLPKPKTKVKIEKPPPFQPVSVLNELHEPPPSAALFPPITPSAMHNRKDWILSPEISAGSNKVSDVLVTKKRKLRQGNEDGRPLKRISHRPHRMKWSKRETEYLEKGVAIYGMGKWKKILNHSEFSFQEGRTTVDLKDRFRTCFPQRVQSRSRLILDESGTHHIYDTSGTPDQSLIALNPRDSNDTSSSFVQEKITRLRRTRSPGPKRKKARRKPWSQGEDLAVIEGYRQHGFQWKLIANDPSLNLSNRTGNQVRDRFRIKYPEIYGREAVETQKNSTNSMANRKEPLATVGKSNDQSEVQDQDQDQDPYDSDDDETASESGDPGPKCQELSASLGVRPSMMASFDIMSLLNGDDEDTRPSASLRYDGWDDNVTLPPLLWEDMATRPMFDLE